MKRFVRSSRQYEKEAKEHGKWPRFFEMDRKTLLENDDFKRQLVHKYYWRSKYREHLASIYRYEERTIHGEDVGCCFAMRLIGGNDKELKKFNNTTVPADCETIVGWKEFSKEEKEEIWKEIEDELSKRNEDLVALSSEEGGFLHRPPNIMQLMFEHPIYETRLWMEVVTQKKKGDYYPHIQSFRDKFLKFYEETETDPATRRAYEFFEREIHEVAGRYYKYWCCRMEEKDPAGKKKAGWVLLAIGDETQIAAAKKHYARLLEHPDAATLKLYCPKAYPFDTMDKIPEKWFDMECDPASNLNLSHEETDLLASTHKYPLFITGRAGSGKSTMLQYTVIPGSDF